MVKLIKIGEDNYFINNTTGEVVKKYDSTLDLMLVAKLDDGSVLKVKSSEIKELYGGQITFDYSGNKYIIDDGYQNVLIRAGYIVKNNYDSYHILDKSEGLPVRKDLFEYVKEVATKMMKYPDPEVKFSSKENQTIEISLKQDGYKYTVVIDTVNNIVSKNQQRKLNNLPFYPFLKDMDKYGCMYLSIFCQKISDAEDDKIRYENGEKIIIKLISVLNEYAENKDRYKFERIIIKKRLNYIDK